LGGSLGDRGDPEPSPQNGRLFANENQTSLQTGS